MKMRARVVALLALALLALPGCYPDTHACTMVGGIEGALVEIPAGLVSGPARIHVTVCRDSTCRAGRGFVVEAVAGGPRFAAADIAGLGDAFGRGTVRVSADILRGHQVVAHHVEEVPIRRAYPNGKSCDGDGFASVSVRFSPGDARTTGEQAR